MTQTDKSAKNKIKAKTDKLAQTAQTLNDLRPDPTQILKTA